MTGPRAPTWWTSLPRAARWLLLLGVFVGFYFAALRPALSFWDRIDRRAATLQTALDRERSFASPDGDGGVITAAQAVFSRPVMPAGSKLTPEQFSRVVDGVLEFHSVTDRSVNERRVRMSGEQSDQLGAGATDRLILEVTFEAPPETVVAVLSDLERAPEVAAVSRIRLDRSGLRDESVRTIRATIMPEAWIPANSPAEGSR